MIRQRERQRIHHRHEVKGKARYWQKLTHIVTAGLFLASLHGAALAAPVGGEVTVGAGTIAQNGNTTNITQTTDKLGINWQSFNIAKGETVNFIQPGAGSIALNRIVGNSASAIYGALNANGQVFLINPNGVLFAPGAQVNVGGLTASTLNITDNDFKNGRYSFVGQGGQVVNQGTINAGKGGVALLGGQVTNEGVIVAAKGNVALGAGNAVTLDFNGDGLVNLAVDQAATDALAANKNLIEANGGLVVMTARAANALAGTVVNNSGIIRAQSIANVNGEIRLNGGDTGTVVNSGTLDASGLDAGESGGKVTMLGANTVLTKEAKINASGNVNGGFVETSGNTVNLAGTVDADAGTGTAGTWSIDPHNIEIKSGSGTDTAGTTGVPSYVPKTDSSVIYVDNINAALNSGTSVSITTGNDGDKQPGDITLNADIAKTAGGDASLTLTAARDIVLNGDTTNLLNPVISSTSGKLNVVMNVGSTSTKGAVVVEKDIKTNGGSLQFGENQAYAVGTYIGNHPAATNLHRVISTANADNSSGGSIDFYGDVMLGTGADGTEINTAGGNIVFHAKVNSGNKYQFVNFTKNGKTTFLNWNDARTEAETGNISTARTDGYGKAVGEHYLATITSALEDVAVRETAGYKVECWAGGHTDDHITWKWVTGPEQGTAFYDQNKHQAIGGKYSNFCSSEPNNYNGKGEDSLEANYNSASEWNDYRVDNTAIAGYVKETNLADTNLVIRASNTNNTSFGNVSFQGEVGTLKALNNLVINNAAQVQFDGKTVADTTVDIKNIGDVTEIVGSTKTAGTIYTPTLIVNTTGAVNLDNDNNVQKIALTTNGQNKAVTMNDISSTALVVGQATSSAINGSQTITGVTTGAAKVFIRNTGGLTLNQPVLTTLTNTDQAVTLIAGSNTAGAVFTNNVGANAIQMGTGSHWLVYSKSPLTSTLDDVPYAYSQYGTLYSYTASGDKSSDSTKQYGLVDVTHEGNQNGLIYADDLTITPTLTPVVTKAYDGTTDVTDARIKSATNYTVTNTVGTGSLKGLAVSLNAADAVGTYKSTGATGEADKDAAIDKPVTVAGVKFDTVSTANAPTGVRDSAGHSVYNAKLADVATGKGDITKRALNVTWKGGTVDLTKVYDGTTGGSAANITYLRNKIKTTGAVDFGTNGLVGSETIGVTLKAGSLIYTKTGTATKNVGADGISFGIDVDTSGEFAKNYTISTDSMTVTGTGTITPAALTITAVTPNSRVYDGTTNTGVTPTSTGMVTGDSFTTLTEQYTDKNVGTGKKVTVDYVIDDGNGGQNYTVTTTGTETAVGDITVAHITANQIGSVDKVSDGTDTATLGSHYGFTGGYATGDSLTLTGTGVYEPDTATGLTGSAVGEHTTTFTGLTLGGGDAGNYILDNDTMHGIGKITNDTTLQEVEKNTASVTTPTATVTPPAPVTPAVTTVNVMTGVDTGTGTGTGTSITSSPVTLPLGNDVTGSGTNVTGSGTNVTGSGTNVTGSGTNVTGSGTNVTGSGTDVTGTGTSVTGTGTDVTGSGTDITTGPAEAGTGTDITMAGGDAGTPGMTMSELMVTSFNGQSTSYSLGVGSNTAAATSVPANSTAGTTESVNNGSAAGLTSGLPKAESDTSIAVYRVADGRTNHVADYKAEGGQQGILLTAAEQTQEVPIGSTTDYQMTYAVLTVNGTRGTYNVEFNGETVVMVPLDDGARRQVATTEDTGNKPVVMGGMLATMNELATPLDTIKAVYIYKM